MANETVNERLLHEAIRHAVALQRYGNGVLRTMMALLNRAASNIGDELARTLIRLPPESFSVEHLEGMLRRVREINASAYHELLQKLTPEMRRLTDYELGYQEKLFTSVIPPQVLVELPLSRVNPEQVYAAAMARPFQGRLLSEWAHSQEAQAMTRVRDAVRSGFVEQQTVQQIVSRVRGTRAAGYDDGALAIDRRAAEAVVRTAVSHTAGFARDRFMSENESLIKQVEWVATLDSHTTPMCIVRDRKLFTNDATHKPVGHDYPWGAGPGRLHWNCRSTSVAVVKSFREMGIDIPEFKPSTRASIDGEVAADTSYVSWLKKQSAAVQDDVLGATRGKLFRSGEMSIDKFVNRKGDWLTLAELKERDASAFQQ